ncbi:hypothetical protein FX988_00169 [Paraglaciecola mesophila]|uniref:Uncharacterized protein n=1 Tax=Paraglaciecola mesophila TaxID=197222 RepID=A0A857JFG6_9ALTE|nr:hypothetical protein FX988_00169 [Paraglaciecola mesophila]
MKSGSSDGTLPIAMSGSYLTNYLYAGTIL